MKIKSILKIVIFGAIVTFLNHKFIRYDSSGKIINSNSIQEPSVVVLLGTPRISKSGKINPYYAYRIEKVLELYQQGKIEKLIISGSQFNKYRENEIELMSNDLMVKGFPLSLTEIDTAHNTFQSIEQLSPEENVVLISQSFHLERAVYIASLLDLNVKGIPATGNPSKVMVIREHLSRVKLYFDFFTSQTSVRNFLTEFKILNN